LWYRAFVLSFILLANTIIAAAAADQDFAGFLEGVRQEALAAGIRQETLDRALTGITPSAEVLDRDRSQPESGPSFSTYLHRALTAKRKAARKQFRANRSLLKAVGTHYHVEPRFIVALWGIESGFGKSSGRFPVIPTLATLAYDDRRGAYFRGELLNALRMVDRGIADPETMLGSWAGAMGQSQFMPSSYLAYAVSWRGAPKPDIWTRRDDVFASIANYLSQSGWHKDEAWGRRVRLPKDFDPALIGLETRKDLREWRRLGVRGAGGQPLPSRSLSASLIQPGGEGPTYLVYENFRVIRKWNSSTYFATTVGILADSLQ